jgi:hypothetical protein
MSTTNPWAQDGPTEHYRTSWRDTIIDRLQKRFDASTNPADREVLSLLIMAHLRKAAA